MSTDDPISLFEEPADDDRLAADGSEPRIVSTILMITATIAALAAVLALINGNLFSWSGAAIVLVAIALALLAKRARSTHLRN